ncbi:MAG: hypothetical protein JWO07_537 [Candidatus Saccharibacteria bacterium]|nr:hypothetical protein [Candidatus Saccharibacteria bacterium]
MQDSTQITKSNIEVVRDYTNNVFNDHSPDRVTEYVNPDVKWHGGTLGTIEGSAGLKAMLEGFIGALPDLHAAEQDIFAQGDKVAVRYVVEATHKGNLFGAPATGRAIRWDAVDIYRITDGKISEEWAADDSTAILHAIGLYTAPWIS